MTIRLCATVYETAIAPIVSLVQITGRLSKFRILKRLLSEAARMVAATNSKIHNELNAKR